MIKLLNNLNLLSKIVIPLFVVAVVAAGLIAYAHGAFGDLAQQTRQIVDVQAERQESILRTRISVNEASVQSRNMILDQSPSNIDRAKYKFEAANATARKSVDRLIELSESPQRRAANQALRGDVDAFITILDRTNALAVSHDTQGATQLLFTEASSAREKLRENVQGRVEVLNAELKRARDDAEAAAQSATRVLVTTGVAGLLLAAALSAAIVIFGITRPLAGLVGVLQRMAKGDIDAEIEASSRGDEIGAVGRAVENIKAMVAKKAAEEAERRQIADEAAAAERKRTMFELADGFERAVGGIVGMLSSSATELHATAQTMTATATETASQSTTVAAAAEEAASNVQTVAAAAEELGSSVQEIGRQVAGSAGLAQAAVGEADETTRLVQAMSQAAAKIGDVVGLISNIAGQTNLLALNATIEAARAGEAGRGFAVVASEVKELASQTTKATEVIGQQIAAIQGVTDKAVSAIGGIAGRIREINAVATGIAAAVEEQGAATQEIVRNVAQAAAGTSEVTSNITGVAQASEETGAAAAQVLSAASELSRQSEHLGGEVVRFLETVRAA